MTPRHDQVPAGSPSGAGQTPRQGPAEEHPLEISHAEMNGKYDTGEAVPFAKAVPWLVRYDGSWWVVYERGWLRVTDEPTATDLDQRAAQLTEAEVKEGRDEAIRSAVTGLPTSPGQGQEPAVGPFPPEGR